MTDTTTIAARQRARLLFRRAREAGAVGVDFLDDSRSFTIEPGAGSPFAALVDNLLSAGEQHIRFTDENGDSLTWVWFIPSNGADAISDYGSNPWAHGVIDPIYDIFD